MTRAVTLRGEAQEDLAEAAAWYEAQRNGLGHDFLDQVDSTRTRIAERPELYATVHREVRRALVGRFPFGIDYRIEEDGIVVIAIMHGYRHPRRWQERTSEWRNA